VTYHLVRLRRGPAWDPARGRREQAGWAAHAAFMDDLVRRAVVVLGGPVGADVDAGDAVVVVAARDEGAVRGLLAADPWSDTMLAISTVEPWTIWLGAAAVDRPR
jgi:hypothetical protein